MIRIFLARVIATYRKAFPASGNKSVIITTGRSNPLNLQMDSTSPPAPSPPNGFKSKAPSRPYPAKELFFTDLPVSTTTFNR